RLAHSEITARYYYFLLEFSANTHPIPLKHRCTKALRGGGCWVGVLQTPTPSQSLCALAFQLYRGGCWVFFVVIIKKREIPFSHFHDQKAIDYCDGEVQMALSK
ncbi:MAG: hypothetical protein K5683_10920, partial [Prevotella sp.]|nr:hypothetical protein [Prevotella sp.]